MESKTYLNSTGLARLLTGLSTSIKNHTSPEIEFEETVDQETGEVVKEVKYPENFTSVKSVVDYLKNRSSIRILQDNTSSTENGYEVSTNEIVYNGENEVQINLSLTKVEDIDNLF